jgi:hypothetical protein
MLWDRGTWQPESADVDSSLQKGEIKFTLGGRKLQGSWVLVRTPGLGNNGVPDCEGRTDTERLKSRRRDVKVEGI